MNEKNKDKDKKNKKKASETRKSTIRTKRQKKKKQKRTKKKKDKTSRLSYSLLQQNGDVLDTSDSTTIVGKKSKLCFWLPSKSVISNIKHYMWKRLTQTISCWNICSHWCIYDYWMRTFVTDICELFEFQLTGGMRQTLTSYNLFAASLPSLPGMCNNKLHIGQLEVLMSKNHWGRKLVSQWKQFSSSLGQLGS